MGLKLSWKCHLLRWTRIVLCAYQPCNSIEEQVQVFLETFNDKFHPHEDEDGGGRLLRADHRNLETFNDKFHQSQCPDQVSFDSEELQDGGQRNLETFNDEFHLNGKYCLAPITMQAQPLASTDALKAPSVSAATLPRIITPFVWVAAIVSFVLI
jgi:hypothetical protein